MGGDIVDELRLVGNVDQPEEVAQEKQAAGLPGDGAGLAPNYLRLSQAERERLARENR